MIRQVEKQDKEAWYALDKHLPESVFDEKVRCYLSILIIAKKATESSLWNIGSRT